MEAIRYSQLNSLHKKFIQLHSFKYKWGLTKEMWKKHGVKISDLAYVANKNNGLAWLILKC